MAQLAHERDYFRTSETRFDDEENTGTLALALDHDFERLLLTVQAQTQWRRFARAGDTELLQQPLTLDVEKDFRAHGVFLSLDWFGEAIDNQGARDAFFLSLRVAALATAAAFLVRSRLAPGASAGLFADGATEDVFALALRRRDVSFDGGEARRLLVESGATQVALKEVSR